MTAEDRSPWELAPLVALFVVLPVGLLAYAGLRSVERDRRLHAEELAAGYRALAGERAAAFDARLRDRFATWLDRVADVAAGDIRGLRALQATLAGELGHPVQGVIVASDGDLLYPAAPPPAGGPGWPVVAADRLERRLGDPLDDDALLARLDALASSEPELAPLCAQRRATILGRRGQHAAAAEALERAVAGSAQLTAYFAVAVRLEAAEAHRAAGDARAAAARALEVLEVCVARPEELPRAAAARYLAEQARALLDHLTLNDAERARRASAVRLAGRRAAEADLRRRLPALRASVDRLAAGARGPLFAGLRDGGVALDRRGSRLIGLRIPEALLTETFGGEGAPVALVRAGEPAYVAAFARAPIPLLPEYAVAAAPADRAGSEAALRARITSQLALLGAAVLLAGCGGAFVVRAYLRARAASRAKSAFIARISHELRTPLALIKGVAETLAMGRADRDPERRARYLATLQRESDALSRLVEGVLDFGALDQGQLGEPEPTDVASLVGEVCESVRDWAEADGFRVALEAPDAPLELRLDRDAVRLALLNLLANAVKYGGGEEAAERCVDVALRRAGGSGARIEVADRGRGLDADEAERIFRPFVRGAAARPGIRGAGLGLALVREVARRHGGRATARRRDGGGAVFSLTLRDAREEEQ